MFKWIIYALLYSAIASVGSHAQAGFAWPNGAKAAVSLAYDDTLASQLDTALPALNTHGLKASFYLQLSSPLLTARLSDWRAA